MLIALGSSIGVHHCAIAAVGNSKDRFVEGDRLRLSSVSKKSKEGWVGIGSCFFCLLFSQFFVVVVSHYVFFVNAIGNSDADVACKPTNPLKVRSCAARLHAPGFAHHIYT